MTKAERMLSMQQLSAPVLPPPVETSFTAAAWGHAPTIRPDIWAERDRHPIAALIILRQAAAATIERLLAFLDETDGLDLEAQVDDEPCDTDELDDDMDSGIGDLEGLLEQLAGMQSIPHGGVVRFE